MIARIKKAFLLWKLSKEPRVNHTLTEDDRKESARVRALNTHIKTLETINLKQAAMIEDYDNRITTDKKGSVEDKLIDIFAARMLGSKPPLPLNSPDAGGEKIIITDEMIRANMEKVPRGQLKQALLLGDNVFKESIKTQYPDLPVEVIERGVGIAKELVLNGS